MTSLWRRENNEPGRCTRDGVSVFKQRACPCSLASPSLGALSMAGLRAGVPEEFAGLVVANPLAELPVVNAKQIKNTTELHMGAKGIEVVWGFDRFVNLEVLWLNNNKVPCGGAHAGDLNSGGGCGCSRAPTRMDVGEDDGVSRE